MRKGVVIIIVLLIGLGWWFKGQSDANNARGRACVELSLAMTAGVQGDMKTSNGAIQRAVDAAATLPEDDPFRAEIDGWGGATDGTKVAAFMERRCPF